MKRAYLEVLWTKRFGRQDARQMVEVRADDEVVCDADLEADATSIKFWAEENKLIRVSLAEPEASSTWSFQMPGLDPISYSLSRQVMLSPRETKTTGFVGYRIIKVEEEVQVQEPIYTKSPENVKIGLDNVELPE